MLVAGGSDDITLLASAEVYDPTTGTWTTTGSMAQARFEHTASLYVATDPNRKLAGYTVEQGSKRSAELHTKGIGHEEGYTKSSVRGT